MAAIGGSLKSMEIAGRYFSSPADTDIKYSLGGYNNDAKPTGDGKGIVTQTMTLCSASGCVVVADASKGDLEYLQDFANSGKFRPVVLNFAGGESYSANMQINGELSASTQSATASFDLMGEGTMKKL